MVEELWMEGSAESALIGKAGKVKGSSFPGQMGSLSVFLPDATSRDDIILIQDGNRNVPSLPRRGYQDVLQRQRHIGPA
jgi:hypothetical protein